LIFFVAEDFHGAENIFGGALVEFSKDRKNLMANDVARDRFVGVRGVFAPFDSFFFQPSENFTPPDSKHWTEALHAG